LAAGPAILSHNTIPKYAVLDEKTASAYFILSMYIDMGLPAQYIFVLYRDYVDMSNAWLIMYSDKAVNYMNNGVHAHDCDDKYRAAIDHSKDIVATSRNNSVLTRYEAHNYIDLMILSRYLSAMYLYDGTMSMYKMVSIGRYFAIFPYGDALTAPYDALTAPGKLMLSGYNTSSPFV